MPEQTTLPLAENGKTPWDRLFAADLRAVHLICCSAQPRIGRAAAIAISKLGNGWIYPIMGFTIFAFLGRESLRLILIGGLNAGLLHLLYPHIKRRIGRPRPFQADPRLRSLMTVLDEHSFPSGHMMTLSGVLVPVVLVWPAAALSAAALLLATAWSRVATAHHYPTDVLAGTLLGITLACPISAGFLAVW